MTTVDDPIGLLAGAPATATYSDLHAAFVRYTMPEIAALLRDVADRARNGSFPAGRPYQHVNGFTKIVIAEHPAGRLTLHYWAADPGKPEDVSRPHDHRFAFTSLLLGGVQQFDEFAVTDDRADEQWARYAYQPFFAGRFARVAPRGIVGLNCVNIATRAPLDGYYTTTPAIVHRAITSRRQACATLVLRGPRERRTSNVYYRPTDPAPRGGLQYGRHISRTEVARQIEHAASFIPRT